MFCPVCGNRINGGDTVCRTCGFNLAGIDAQAKTQLSDVTVRAEETVFSDALKQPDSVSQTANLSQPLPAAPPAQVNKSPLEAIMISYTFCGNCGRRNITGVNFCGCCGEQL